MFRLGCLLLVLLSTGCATIITGTTQPVTFTSDPPGATVRVNGVPRGVTPTTIVMKRGLGSKMATFEKDGHQTAVELGSSFNGWFLGNLLFGGVIGMAIDLVDGAVVWISPDNVFAQLPSAAAVTAAP